MVRQAAAQGELADPEKFPVITMLVVSIAVGVLPALAIAGRMMYRALNCKNGGWEYARIHLPADTLHLPADTLRLTGVLLLCLSVSLGSVAILENRIHAELDETIRHEGKYYARLPGDARPGAVGEKSLLKKDKGN